MNLLFILSLCFTNFCNFLLICRLVGNPLAAFAGSAIATYGNFIVIGFLSAGQAQMISGEWLPLYILLMLCALHGTHREQSKDVQWEQAGTNSTEERNQPVYEQMRTYPERRSWLTFAALSVLVLVIMSLTDWQYVLYAVLVTIFYFVFLLLTRHNWREMQSGFIKLAAIGVAYGAIVFFPLVLPMI